MEINSYSELIAEVGVWVAAVLTVVQISPIKFDPWSYILSEIGKAMTGDLAKEVKDLNTKVCDLEKTVHEGGAVAARIRILRFGDEVYRGTKHTKEHFDQCLRGDVTTYEQYCNDHPEFANNMTQLTVQHIKDVYAKCLEDHSFL